MKYVNLNSYCNHLELAYVFDVANLSLICQATL